MEQKEKHQATKAKKQGMLKEFFGNQLKEMLYIENKSLELMQEMEENCYTEELEDAINEHRHQTEKQVKRLKKCFRLIEVEPEEKKSVIIDNLLNESQAILKEASNSSRSQDALISNAAQKLEHVEIDMDNGLIQLALTMGKEDVAELLEKNYHEEYDSECLLKSIGEEKLFIEDEESQT